MAPGGFPSPRSARAGRACIVRKVDKPRVGGVTLYTRLFLSRDVLL